VISPGSLARAAGRGLLRLCVASSSLLLWAPRATAYPLPSDAGALNVHDYGAVGDGIADDTAAIQMAIDAACADGNHAWPAKLVYFPAGNYLVSDTLVSRGASGKFMNSMALMGESPGDVKLTLRDRAAGFSDPRAPKALIFATSGLLARNPSDGGRDYFNKGEGNDAYNNYVHDLTINLGAGNPGAIGVDFLANNIGAIRGVRIAAADGSCHEGIALDRKWPGPLLIQDVRVDGCAFGISIANTEYSATLEDVVLSNQRQVGLRNDGNSLAMRRVSIIGAPRALENINPAGLIVADYLRVVAPVGGQPALTNAGFMVLSHPELPAGPTNDSSSPIHSMGVYRGATRLRGESPQWLLQPPAAFPAPTNRAPSTWANVRSYGAEPDSNKDATDAIRGALASGADTIYFPSGRYLVSDSIDVPERVRRLVGMFSVLAVGPRRRAGFSANDAVLRASSTGTPLIIERFTLDHTNRGSQVGVELSGPRDVLLRDMIFSGLSVRRSRYGGHLFLENVTGCRLDLSGKKPVDARQLNTEGGGVRIANSGAPLLVLGIKTEQACTVVHNTGGARTEIVGGLLYPVHPSAAPLPAFVNTAGSDLSAAYAESAHIPGAVYLDHLVTTSAGGTSWRIADEQLPPRGLGRFAPFITSRSLGPGPSKARSAM